MDIKKGITAWITRNEPGAGECLGALYIHFSLPERSSIPGINPRLWRSGIHIRLKKDHLFGNGLVWADEPRKIKLVDVQQQAFEMAVLREIENQHISLMAFQCREASQESYLSRCNHPELKTCKDCIKDTIRQQAETKIKKGGQEDGEKKV